MADHPILECEETAKRIIARGGTVYQKWSCGGCGSRITANNPNTFTIKGHCEDCGHVTDILATGCNYLAVIPVPGRSPSRCAGQEPEPRSH